MKPNSMNCAREYDARMPQQLQGKLDQLIRAYAADGAFPDLVAVMQGSGQEPT